MFRATDDNSIPGSPRLSFSNLNPDGGPAITLNRSASTIDAQIPHCQIGGTKRPPWIAADPTDGNRFFVVYHDTISATSPDVDVYCVTVSRPSPTGTWSAGAPVRVNKDTVGASDADQFQPVVAVDANGNVHVLFYDDRNYDQPDVLPYCSTNPGLRFDAYYCRSTSHGATFTETAVSRLVSPPDCEGGAANAPAVKYSLFSSESMWTGFDMGDYIGLTTHTQNGITDVFMVYTGTDDCDLPNHPSVIWFNRSIQH